MFDLKPNDQYEEKKDTSLKFNQEMIREISYSINCGQIDESDNESVSLNTEKIL